MILADVAIIWGYKTAHSVMYWLLLIVVPLGIIGFIAEMRRK